MVTRQEKLEAERKEASEASLPNDSEPQTAKKSVYAKAKEDAVANKRTKQISVDYVEFKEAGIAVLGKFIGTNPVKSSLNDETYNQYLFDTDSGPCKFACGGQFDNEAGRLMNLGAVYEIEYLGKVDLKGGHRVNRFNVTHFPQPGEVDPDEEEIAADHSGN